MALQCGIVGLPNVGKSSLFNALAGMAAPAENYPFCTIEPNIGVVAVADQRLDRIAQIAQSAEVVPASVRLVDIAGLVKGAAQGEGLGNKFLAHIREVDGIVHVLRCFDDDQIAHVAGQVDPIEDANTVELELALADLATVTKVIERHGRLARSGDKDARKVIEVLEKMVAVLDQGKAARTVELASDELVIVNELNLLTRKPVLYCANIGDDDTADNNSHYAAVARHAKETGAGALAISAKIEAELAVLEPAEKAEMLAELGLEMPGLARLAAAAYDLLGLQTFFTAGPKEARAWEFKKGTVAEQAAGLIHTDMQRGFIRAETIGYDDYIELGGESKCRDAGKLRLEGRDYVVCDGDVMHFRFNV